jgi:hypothetical protein
MHNHFLHLISVPLHFTPAGEGKFNHNYPKVEYPKPNFLKDASIIRNLIFAIQQDTIMQG